MSTPDLRPEKIRVHGSNAIALAVLIGGCLAACLPAQAADTGNNKDQSKLPVYIKANHAELNRASRTSTYTGSVKVDQGRLHLTGNRLVVNRDKGDESNFTSVMTGDPAHLVQDPEEKGQSPTYAHAKRIKYDSKTGVLHLLENAHVRQGSNTLSGKTVTYNTQTRQVEANRSGNRRVHITINPNSPPGQQSSGKAGGKSKKSGQGNHSQ
jgi:lipopolysaccharide transport protein LptA